MVEWANLWKWLCWTPGTWWKRTLLAVWQFGLMLAPTAGYVVWGWWGIAAGVAVGFFAHELFFMAFARYVARTPPMDDGDTVGQAHRSDYTFERWIGPVC